MKKEFEDTVIIDYTDLQPGDDAPDPLSPEEMERRAKEELEREKRAAAVAAAAATAAAPATTAARSAPAAPPPPQAAQAERRRTLPLTIPMPPAMKSPPPAPPAAPKVPLLVTAVPPPAPKAPPAPATMSPPPPKAPPAPAAMSPPPPKAPPPAATTTPPPPKAPPPAAAVFPAPPKPPVQQKPAAPEPVAVAAQPSSRPTAANVIVLSADPALIDLLRDSLAGSHRVWRADDMSHAADLMVAAGNAVFLIDSSLADHDTRDLVNQVHTQFPELPIIVAGRRDDEAQLAPLVSSGAIFRFLHKPASADRIRNFVDATQRRANPVADLPAVTSRTASPTAITGTHLALESSRIDLPRLELPKLGLGLLHLDPALIRRWTQRSLLLIPIVLLVWGLLEWKPWDGASQLSASDQAQTAAPASSGPDPQIQKLLDHAAVALSQGRLVDPPGDNALELYRAVLAQDPGNTTAQRGIDSVAEELLVQAERALMEGDVARLASAVDAVRSVRPDHPRLEFFTMQLQRERERERQGQAGPGRPAPGATASAATDADAERLQSLLQLANDRIRSNRLVGGKDTAHAYLLAARKLDPQNADVQQATQALSGILQKNASQAIRENRLDDASNWVTQAAALDVNGEQIAALRANVEAARVGNVRAERAKLLVLANQRIAQGRLLEPAGDSARGYLDLLRAADPVFDGLADTTTLFATRALTEARQLVASGSPDRAEVLLRAATDAGAPASEVAAITADIAAAREARVAAARKVQVLPENQLRRTRTVSPSYPERALAKGIEGWVDVEFTVGADGSVRDAVVKAAEPAGTFDRAAVNAVERWRYEPRLVNGAAVDTRVATRLRFQLQD